MIEVPPPRIAPQRPILDGFTNRTRSGPGASLGSINRMGSLFNDDDGFGVGPKHLKTEPLQARQGLVLDLRGARFMLASQGLLFEGARFYILFEGCE